MQTRKNRFQRRVSQKDRVVTAIIHDILNGKRLPGEPLRELTIAKELGTSQAPVREALRELQGQGYVTHKPRCGSTVALFTAKELYQTYDIREALESFSISTHGRRLEIPENRDNLHKILADFDKVETLDSFIDMDFRFHELLIKLCRNDHLYTIWQQVMNRARIASFFLTTRIPLETTIPVHHSIGEYLSRKDYSAAVEQLRHHYAELRETTSTDKE